MQRQPNERFVEHPVPQIWEEIVGGEFLVEVVSLVPQEHACRHDAV